MAGETSIQILKEPEMCMQLLHSCMSLIRSEEDSLPPIILFRYTETKAKYNIKVFWNKMLSFR